MYKLRPLDDNPIEHRGSRCAGWCSDTESCLCCTHLLPTSLPPPLQRLTANTLVKTRTLSQPMQTLGRRVSVSSHL